jgi:hypothetical protein
VPDDDQLREQLIFQIPNNIKSLRKMQAFSKSASLNSDFVYQQLLKRAEEYYLTCLATLEKSSPPTPDHWPQSILFKRRPRLVEALYYEWLTRFLKVLQGINLFREPVDAKYEIAKVYSWYRTLEVYLKPEEDALLAEKTREQYERLERTKNIKFDENFTGFEKTTPTIKTLMALQGICTAAK